MVQSVIVTLKRYIMDKNDGLQKYETLTKQIRKLKINTIEQRNVNCFESGTKYFFVKWHLG